MNVDDAVAVKTNQIEFFEPPDFETCQNRNNDDII